MKEEEETVKVSSYHHQHSVKKRSYTRTQQEKRRRRRKHFFLFPHSQSPSLIPPPPRQTFLHPSMQKNPPFACSFFHSDHHTIPRSSNQKSLPIPIPIPPPLKKKFTTALIVDLVRRKNTLFIFMMPRLKGPTQDVIP